MISAAFCTSDQLLIPYQMMFCPADMITFSISSETMSLTLSSSLASKTEQDVPCHPMPACIGGKPCLPPQTSLLVQLGLTCFGEKTISDTLNSRFIPNVHGHVSYYNEVFGLHVLTI